MKYKQIIQELKESKDSNVQLFLLDAEKIVKLPSKVKKGMLTQLQNPGVIDTVAETGCDRHPRQELHSHDHQDRLSEQLADEFGIVSRPGGRGRFGSLQMSE